MLYQVIHRSMARLASFEGAEVVLPGGISFKLRKNRSSHAVLFGRDGALFESTTLANSLDLGRKTRRCGRRRPRTFAMAGLVLSGAFNTPALDTMNLRRPARPGSDLLEEVRLHPLPGLRPSRPLCGAAGVLAALAGLGGQRRLQAASTSGLSRTRSAVCQADPGRG